MADLQALEQLDVTIRRAERSAIHGLIAYLRDAVRELPSEARLALVFAQQARQLEGVVGESTPSLGTEFHLGQIEKAACEFGVDDEGCGA